VPPASCLDYRDRFVTPHYGSHPVYSAETTDGHEAEYIDDRLPSKMAKRLLLGLVAFGCACGVLAGLWYGLATR